MTYQKRRRYRGGTVGIVHAMAKTLNHLTFEIGALRRELAAMGLARTNARRKELDPALVARVYSARSRGSSASTSARSRATKSGRHSASSPGMTD